ncbi:MULTISPECIES: glutaredoxin family protein [Leucobacter]|uniref:Mycoredoxin n=1 Tax=Leucobacter iarius TaxID=333963 RepID=A0ABN2LF32_9MICO|nr:glutaredoxin domain-containing protein [Leucobacter sp. Ag1]KKI17008.1 glutaredoxin [Leucobacter sp. Ag1]
MSDSTASASAAPQIRVFGADWCGDCRRAKRVLNDLEVPFEWVDLVEDPAAADVARDISGRTNIPVVTFPDGTHQVEPSDGDLRSKLAELGLTARTA